MQSPSTLRAKTVLPAPMNVIFGIICNSFHKNDSCIYYTVHSVQILYFLFLFVVILLYFVFKCAILNRELQR